MAWPEFPNRHSLIQDAIKAGFPASLFAGQSVDPATTVVNETTFGIVADPGIGVKYAREDHTHGSPTNPLIAHEAAPDPHPQYATNTELTTHENAGDPHAQYALDTDLSNHESAADPHPAYQRENEKDSSGGYAGLTLYKINFKNTANTFTSLLANSNTAARTYTFPDKDMTVADNADFANKVVGPASAVANRVAVFSGTSGKLIDDSGATISGSNTGDQTISLTGEVTGSGTGSFAATITAGAVSNSKLANMVTKTVKGRTTAGTGVPEDIAIATTLKTDLALVKADVGLGSVDNTADAVKSVANAVEWAGAALTISAAAPSGGADGDIWFQYV